MATLVFGALIFGIVTLGISRPGGKFSPVQAAFIWGITLGILLGALLAHNG